MDMVFLPFITNSAIKHKYVSLNGMLIRNQIEFDNLLYLNESILTEFATIWHKLK